HGEQRGTESEALEHRRGVTLVDQYDERGTEQAQAHGQEADHTARTERDLHGLRTTAAALTRGRRDPEVRARGEPHSGAADRRAEQRTHDEEERAANLDRGDASRDFRHRKHVENHHGDHNEDAERLELAQEVRLRALLDGFGDFLHFLGALTGAENRLDQGRCEAERNERDGRGDDDKGQVLAGQGEFADGDAPHGHSLSSCTKYMYDRTPSKATGWGNSAGESTHRRARLRGRGIKA